MDKKQIEEMAKIANFTAFDYRQGTIKSKTIYTAIAEAIYKYLTEDSVVLAEREFLDNCELNYDKGYKKALADLEKDGKVVLSREEYAELRNSEEVGELVKENRVLGKQCLDWMKLYHKQLTKTKQSSKETAEKILEVCISPSLRQWIFENFIENKE